tara:strand:+ start:79 stop:540 length:462 start_codon:yes stop_codon:yes gene_type:complete
MAVKRTTKKRATKTAAPKATSAKSAAKTSAGLNFQQEDFCQLYVSPDRELFGNGVQCYLAIYGEEYFEKNRKPMSYQVAMSASSRLLSNVKVIDRINALLEEGGFNDVNVDKQLLFLINQHADLKTKAAAIREYNSLRNRVKRELEVKHTLIV